MKTLDIGLLFANKIIKDSIGEIAYATDNPEVCVIGDSTNPLQPLQDAYYMPSGERNAYEIKDRTKTYSFQLISENKVLFYSNPITKKKKEEKIVGLVQPTGIYNDGKLLEYAYVSNSLEKGTVIKKIKSDGRKIFVSSGALSGCTACNIYIPELDIGYFFHVGGCLAANYTVLNKNQDLFNAILYALTLTYSETNQPLLSERDVVSFYIDKELDVTDLWQTFDIVWNKITSKKYRYFVYYYYKDCNGDINSGNTYIQFQHGTVYPYCYSTRGMLLCTYEPKTCNSYYMLSENQKVLVGDIYLYPYRHLRDTHLEVRGPGKCNIV